MSTGDKMESNKFIENLKKILIEGLPWWSRG